MEKQIDWSKAPECATHARFVRVEPNGCAIVDFFRLTGSKFEYLNKGGDWSTAVSSVRDCVARPVSPTWNGEGLPPVGVVCELSQSVLLANADTADWFSAGTQVEVGGHANFEGSTGAVCVVCVVGENFTGTIVEVCLRPIKTAEQIAAEERQKAIDEFADELAGYEDCAGPLKRHQSLAHYLHAQGYRKQ